MEKHEVLAQLLGDLAQFLKLLDQEKLSGNATVQKCLLSDLLQSYTSANGCDEEYIYMNKVMVCGQNPEKSISDREDTPDGLTNGRAGKHFPAPQKSLPDLPQTRTCLGRDPLPLPMPDSPEGYYEEAQPYDTATNDMGCFGRRTASRRRLEAEEGVVYSTISREDCEAVSSSYESYDEEEVSKGKSSTPHQWPSTEASIELMRDTRICAFLWRKKWLGQWAKQLCVIKEHRLLCYKSSKEQVPQLDVSLVGCSVVYKEKQLKKKEHKLKITPVGAEAIVLGLQSKEQTQQWLKAIQEISSKHVEGTEVAPYPSDSPRLICTQGELGERYSVASESGSSTDSHTEAPENKDVKKKHGPGLKFSNLMNIGKKKTSSLDSPEKSIDTSGILNVLVNSQWRARWCLIKNGQLWFYQDKAKTKVAQQPVPLAGCVVLPDPSPDHLYSFRIQQDGEQLATLEAKSSAVMGHWLGLLLSQTGSKMDPEDLTYDYVDSDRISCIVNAARTSMYLMQRRFSEPNAYTDSLPVVSNVTDDIYDDVAATEPEPELEESQESGHKGSSVEPGLKAEPDTAERLYLDLIPVRSFLHPSSGHTSPKVSSPTSQLTDEPKPPSQDPELSCSSTIPPLPPRAELDQLCPSVQVQAQPQKPLSNPDSQNPSHSNPDPQKSVSNIDPQKLSVSNADAQKPLLSNVEPHKPPLPNTDPEKLPVYSPDTHKSPLSNANTHKSPLSNADTQKSHLSNVNAQKPPLSNADTQKSPLLSTEAQRRSGPGAPSPQHARIHIEVSDRPRPTTAGSGSIEVKLGKNRTEADVRRFSEERDRLEREREEVRNTLAALRQQRRELKEALTACRDPARQRPLEVRVKEAEEACRLEETKRVELELHLMDVKESLKKVEAGPFTLGTTVDCGLLDTVSTSTPKAPSCSSPAAPSSNCTDASPVNSATALKSRPLSIMAASKGNVLQKAKEWEKKVTT
ncbi:actin filament-associated protein 1-like 2 isoform X2 [Conger conger]|uniref:actin filament-associated protein 1-like 2 isoform X2 n=1 Tax=Conger conger TaxID=82655 RepID=UPI002A5A0661|nr:actin filament-associated protein 1-like 2 isoform X2 [Conger conger]